MPGPGDHWSRIPYVAVVALALIGAALTDPPREPEPEPPVADPLAGCAMGVSAEVRASAEASYLSCADAMLLDSATVTTTIASLELDETAVPRRSPSSVPVVVRLAAGAVACEPGAGSPVVGTEAPLTLSADLPALFAISPRQAVFEYEMVGTEDTHSALSEAGTTARAVIGPDELVPGATFRWRVSSAFLDTASGQAFEPTWSRWCEFSVAADAPDLRGIDSTVIEAARGLGLRPERRYTAGLPAEEWGTLLSIIEPDLNAISETGAVEINGEVDRTLTGAQWVTVLDAVANWAMITDEAAVEEPDYPPSDGRAYWQLLDRLSADLGGPHHPTMGYTRR